ncbi:GNAT family N-acetyltransferase [Methylobacterium planeticum]|uniref:GNAT family N-acetyltransferase n=1 Tax=Methylobacterium planeticum TaxID=2615211 RepID=A0A6N6MNZ4_9HYPH|nr:GNAT family N-acetyltransferase [Methylobacterium planeticum]KAB1072636.1 GNAT family N-acetyltransferase [Methylobacterium planeticum]
MIALRSPNPDAVALVEARSLAREPEAWDDLVARSREPHPHFSRHVLTAHMAAGLAPADLRLVTVRRAGRLVAALPYRLRRDLCGLGGQVARPFLSPLVTATPPLVAREADLPETLSALVAGLGEASGGRAWRWPLLPAGSPLGQGLLAAMRAAGWACGSVAAFERPILDRRASHAAFLDGHPHRARFKDLRRRERRLAEVGHVTFETATEGPALAAAVEAFLTLERAGWKGAAGTAMASRPEGAALARGLFGRTELPVTGRNPTRTEGPVTPRADLLRLDGRPVAVSLALVAGGTATLLKTAYDETQRASAPGLLLEARIIEAMHRTGFAERLDSATLAGSALESLYRERETIAEIIAVPPGGALSLDRRLRLARFEHEARAEAKRLLRRA